MKRPKFTRKDGVLKTTDKKGRKLEVKITGNHAEGFIDGVAVLGIIGPNAEDEVANGLASFVEHEQ